MNRAGDDLEKQSLLVTKPGYTTTNQSIPITPSGNEETWRCTVCMSILMGVSL